MTDILAVIPARFASGRFPGKPLAMLCGKPVVQWVYEAAAAAVPHAVVATDDVRIVQAVEAFGGKAVLTSPTHHSGTDRCCEAWRLVRPRADIVVNIQGDEPLVQPAQITALVKCLVDSGAGIATLIRAYDGDYDTLADPGLCKVEVDCHARALSFSRAVIPAIAGEPPQQWPALHRYYTHMGIYAFCADTLRSITALPPSPLEMSERLEQLRWLQAGCTIATAITDIPTIGIDTPADLAKAQTFLQQNHV